MSLLDSAPETITVYPAGPAQPDGSRGPEGAPVTVRCRVQPSTSTTQPADGYTDLTIYRVIARRLPAGPWSRVHWDGRDWTVTEQPAAWRGSKRTAHDEATIRRR